MSTATEYAKLISEYQFILSELPCAVIFISGDGTIRDFNKTAQTILGRDKEGAVGKHFGRVFTCKKLQDQISQTLQSSEPFFMLEKVNNVEVIIHCVPVTSGGDSGMLIIFEDQTEKNALYSELNIIRQLNQELTHVLESSYDGMIIADHKGKIIKANKSVERITGFQPEVILQKTMFQLEKEGYVKINEIQANKHTRIIKQRLNTGKEVLVTSNHIFNQKGELSFIISNIKDLTEIKQQMEPLNLTEKYYNELNVFRDKVNHIIFDSSEMSGVLEKAYKVAKVDSTVLISGESGVGKEVISKFIYNNSQRRNGPMISINCGAIPENLLESELFGHEKGAFTGATEKKLGLFELANNGTIFLDEIAELQLNLQIKLLRFLQEKEIYRVGGNKPIQLNVRIISATNKDMSTLVRNKLFREDLFYRLNVIPIHIPPLRNRKKDIRPLVNSFLEKECKKHGIEKTIPPEVLDAFENYDWPGNVRELLNVVEYLVVMSRDSVIHLDELPDNIINRKFKNIEININKLIPLKEAKEIMEREVVVNALRKYRSTKKVAEALKMDNSTIFRIMKKYKLTDNPDEDL
ncbi:MAG: sigma 54-interacting transcriptional regulator [Clostridiales bacterium]|jgi:PAS domain S-box-containing protein|nr:sigma 54-interacting transcriptional regulator [Clostridiales bacterium]